MKKLLVGLIFTITPLANAGLIAHNDYTAGTAVTASAQNTNENTIVNEFNGNIESTNIKDGTIVVADLSTAVQSNFVATGVFNWWTGTKSTVPTGWLYCDGSAVSRTTYAALFAIVGTKFGQGDNSTTFNLPDTRGYFVRGQADGQSTDPDAAARTSANTGGSTGDNVGSVQTSTITAHTHTATVTDPGHSHSNHTWTNSGANGGHPFGSDSVTEQAGSPRTDGNSPATTGITVANSTVGGNETRPRNIYMVGIIKS